MISARLHEIRKQRLRGVDLYVVTSEPLSAGRTSLAVLDAVLAAGVRMVQLREKEKSRRELFELAMRFREKTARAGCLLIVNDFVDLALAAGADGVHLGQGDLPIAAARKIAPDLILGASSHSLDQALSAQYAGADYVNIGPIFPTNTKPDHPHVLGTSAIAQIGPKLSVPHTCMGGIKVANIDQVMRAGAKIVAVVTAVTQADDIIGATLKLRQKILAYRT